MKTASEVRQEFLNFFARNDHKIVKSAPVIPQNDPTLLFTNAGMNQFKNIFLGQGKIEYPRVADTQKCIRVSGKHNDLEEVGKDTYHHTFFEMLGNWSFGDYYKQKAIAMAWQLFTEIWRFPKERLWATVYYQDEEAAQAWLKVTDINPGRILRFGEKDNFWEMGEVGPCGPCSEIHYYTGENIQSQIAEKINQGDPHYIELWNLVFIQYDRDATGKLNPLPAKHVDTGAGLERIVAALQGHSSNYDTDLFQPIIAAIADLTGVPYMEKTGMPHRVIADHIRMLTFAIADGGLPSNEGRGYVIRRILRRAARFGRMLNMHEPFIFKLAEVVGAILGSTFPEIVDHQKHIQRIIKAEEKSFGKTLDRGLEVFGKIKDALETAGEKIIPGQEVFKLYDTFGFPVDLTHLLAEENGLRIDADGFEEAMKRQKARARAALNFQPAQTNQAGEWVVLSEGPDSVFTGYQKIRTRSQIRRYKLNGTNIAVVLDRTPFYAESGGEIGDKGTLKGKDFVIDVENVRKSNNAIIHEGKLKGEAKQLSSSVTARVSTDFNRSIRANHTATHLLHAALRRVLGEHVHQAGSLVEPERLRFDFTHFAKLSDDELRQVEDLVNQQILANIPVAVRHEDYNVARASGAMALFGEKYEDVVRTITVGEFSRELCGGKHVKRTGDIGSFRILSESAIAAGVRRIEAVTAMEALKYTRVQTHLLKNISNLLNVEPEKIEIRIAKIIDELKELEKEISRQRGSRMANSITGLIAKAPQVRDVVIVTQQVEVKNIDELKKIGDILRATLKIGVGILAAIIDDRPSLVVVVSDETIKKYGLSASDLVREFGKMLGGGGGGRPHLATAGGKLRERIPDVFSQAQQIIESKLSNIKDT